MKKEIENLLASERADLVLNKFAFLRRWTKDGLGQPCDRLVLAVSVLSSGDCIRDISARDWRGIVDEVQTILRDMFTRSAETLCKQLENGYIG